MKKLILLLFASLFIGNVLASDMQSNENETNIRICSEESDFEFVREINYYIKIKDDKIKSESEYFPFGLYTKDGEYYACIGMIFYKVHYNNSQTYNGYDVSNYKFYTDGNQWSGWRYFFN